MVFGAEKEKGLKLNGFNLEVVELKDTDQSELLVHDRYSDDPTLAYKLAGLDFPKYPYPLGVFRQVERPVFEDAVHSQEEAVFKKVGPSTLEKFLHAGETWRVGE